MKFRHSTLNPQEPAYESIPCEYRVLQQLCEEELVPELFTCTDTGRRLDTYSLVWKRRLQVLFVSMQIYGKEGQFDAARLVDLLGAYESFKVASTSARGSMDAIDLLDASSATALPQGAAPGRYEPGSALHQVRKNAMLPGCDTVKAACWCALMSPWLCGTPVLGTFKHGRPLHSMQDHVP